MEHNDADFLDAIEFGDLNSARMYSGNDKAIKVNLPDLSGKTPLMIAAYYGHKEIVEWLLALGADPYLRNPEGKSSIDLARDNDHHECLKLMKR